LVRGAPGPESVRAVQKFLLVYGLQHHRHGPLKHLVFVRRDAQRSLLSVAFRDVHASHRRGAIRPCFHAAEKRFEVALEVAFVLLRALAIHPTRAIFARAPMRFSQPFDVDVVRQRRQRRRHLLR
jgi:hypothetical protein